MRVSLVVCGLVAAVGILTALVRGKAADHEELPAAGRRPAKPGLAGSAARGKTVIPV
jgi:hypothetical protein